MDRFGSRSFDPEAFARAKEQAQLPLGIRTAEQLSTKYPPVIVEGLFRQSEIILMGGQAKRWKSWARADMLYCIANGFKWLNFPCHQGTVIHLDLELLEADLRWRFEQIHSSYCHQGCKGSLEAVRFVPLRGVPFTIASLEACMEELINENCSTISVDPIYPLLGAKNESDPAAVTELLSRFRTLGTRINSGTALVQHFTKGDQSAKESQDRFSGTRIWNAFPDSLMTFTDLEQENCFSCEFTVRSFQKIEPFAVRWEFPRFRIDEALDPENIKAPKGRPRQTSLEQFCAVLTPQEILPHKDFMHRATKILGISERSFNRRLKEATNAKAIYFSHLEPEGYALSASYIQKNGQ